MVVDLPDVLIILVILFTAYLVEEFQSHWVGNEYVATTYLKLNRRKTTAVFSLAFLASLSVFAGTLFTALEMSGLNSIAFDIGLLLYATFFLLLNRIGGGGGLWVRG